MDCKIFFHSLEFELKLHVANIISRALEGHVLVKVKRLFSPLRLSDSGAEQSALRNKLFAFLFVIWMNTQMKLYSFARSIIGIIMEMKNPSQFSELENLLISRGKRLFASPLTHSISSLLTLTCLCLQFFCLLIYAWAPFLPFTATSQPLIINYSEMSLPVAEDVSCLFTVNMFSDVHCIRQLNLIRQIKELEYKNRMHLKWGRNCLVEFFHDK